MCTPCFVTLPPILEAKSLSLSVGPVMLQEPPPPPRKEPKGKNRACSVQLQTGENHHARRALAHARPPDHPPCPDDFHLRGGCGGGGGKAKFALPKTENERERERESRGRKEGSKESGPRK